MSAAVALCYSGAAGFHGVVSAPARQRSVVMETKAEMIELAKKLNPVVGYWGERFPSSHRIRKVLLLTLSMLS